ncbi:MAG: Gfo/Idh/MocA family oxidoreductase [Alkalispirochaeta sp.]
MMQEKPIRMVVAGTGTMARYHVRRFTSFPGVTIVGCYDRSQRRAEEFSREMGLTYATSDLDALLRTHPVDAVSGAVADSEHYYVAATAIRHNTAVFLEKPFTTTVSEAQHILALQQDYHVPVVVNFSKINYPSMWGMIHAIENGFAGTPQHLDLSYLQSWLITTVWGEWWRDPRWLWRISSSHGGGGALRDLGSHLVYVALCIAGPASTCNVTTEQRADRNAASASGYSCDMNDSFSIRLTHTNGIHTTIRGSYAEAGHVNTVRASLIGSERVLLSDTGAHQNEMNTYRPLPLRSHLTPCASGTCTQHTIHSSQDFEHHAVGTRSHRQPSRLSECNRFWIAALCPRDSDTLPPR